MRIEIIEKTVYSFEDVKNDVNGIKDKVLQNLYDINIYHSWWDFTYDDAKTVDLKISGFDVGRGNFIDIDFIYGSIDTADAILKEHGESCETYKLAKTFKEQYEEQVDTYNTNYELWDNLDYYSEDEEIQNKLNEYSNLYEKAEEEMEELSKEFLQELGNEYLPMLRNEYEYLTSEEGILETLEANEYEFDEDGEIF